VRHSPKRHAEIVKSLTERSYERRRRFLADRGANDERILTAELPAFRKQVGRTQRCELIKNTGVQNVASLPTHVPTLQSIVLEQQHMIETLRAQLHLALHRQFGRRNESVDVDQIGLFAGGSDESTVIELAVAGPERAAEAASDRTPDSPVGVPTMRKKAVRILEDLPREVRIVDLPESERVHSPPDL
jgi:hypothetical protein